MKPRVSQGEAFAKHKSLREKTIRSRATGPSSGSGSGTGSGSGSGSAYGFFAKLTFVTG